MYVWVGGPVVSLSFVHKPGTTQSCGMSGVVELKIRHSKIKRGGGGREGLADKKRKYTGCTPVR